MKRVVVATLFLAQTLLAAPALRPDAEIKAILATRVETGIAVGVIEPAGSRVVSHGKVDGDTLFEIGSITKVFTALLLADMVERGEVKLSDRSRSICRRR